MPPTTGSILLPQRRMLKPKPRYAVHPSGNITRGEEIVGTFDPTTGQILTMVFPEGALSTVKALVLDAIIESRIAHQPAAPPEAGPVHTAEAMKAAVPRDVPPAPEQHPRLGDKTPAYMAWLAKYHPDQFQERYKGRRTHITTGINPHLSAGDIPPGHIETETTEEWK